MIVMKGTKAAPVHNVTIGPGLQFRDNRPTCKHRQQHALLHHMPLLRVFAPSDCPNTMDFMLNLMNFILADMEARTNPSGGDWSLERQGAVLLEGCVGCEITGNSFHHLDTNAVFLSGFNRDTKIIKNEFVWLGQNAIASWGYLDNETQTSMTNSGLGGLQPRGTVIDGNYVHEIGHIQKQSSFYFQAITAQTTIQNNVVFNIPRAGINFNDGCACASRQH